MGFATEVTTEYIRNIDGSIKEMPLDLLEKAPPCRMYFDMGDQLKGVVQGTLLQKIHAGAMEKDLLASTGDIAAVERRKVHIADRLRELIGSLPDDGTALAPKITGRLHGDGFHMEKVIFAARRDVYVTGNLYVPDGLTQPTGAVLFLCGHARAAKAYATYQRVCHLLAKAGLVAFAIDPVGQGERFSYLDDDGNCIVEWGCPEHDYAGAQAIMIGHSIARYFVHDAMRAVDFLLIRPEVDPARIGVTGSSGGGTQSSLMMLLDDRIAAAAPGTFICSLEAIMESGVVQDAEQIWNGLAAESFDHDDILLAMAPKPVCVLACAYDFFPIEGTRATAQSAQRFYELYGAPENFELFIDASEHQYSWPLAKRAADFFSRVFLKRPIGDDISEPELFSEEQCQCTTSGQIARDYPASRFLFHENLEAFERVRAGLADVSEEWRRQHAVAWLKERVYDNRRPCTPNLRKLAGVWSDGLFVQTLLFRSNEGVFSNALCFREAPDQPVSELTLCLWENGTMALSGRRNFLQKMCAEGRAVVLLDVSGRGAQRPNRINTMPMYDFEGTLCGFSQHMLWYGDSIAALRTYEIIAAIGMLKNEPEYSAANISLYAEDRLCLPAAAALLATELPVVKAEFQDASGFMPQVSQRFYDASDVMSNVFPGSAALFDDAELMRWALRP